MTLTDAIAIRRSRRKYSDTPISTEAVSGLQEQIAEYNRLEHIRMELVLDNGAAFRGFRRNYGMLKGVNNYIGLIAGKHDPNAPERLGYYGELLILHATAIGLGTCWVGGMFDSSAIPFSLTVDETLVCTIVLGNTEAQDSTRERFFRGLIHRKTKSAAELFKSDTADVPAWFLKGMDAVEKAPSALHKQPAFFSYKAGKTSAMVPDITGGFRAIDLGIAKLHFALGAGGGEWTWGNHGEFIRKTNTSE